MSERDCNADLSATAGVNSSNQFLVAEVVQMRLSRTAQKQHRGEMESLSRIAVLALALVLVPASLQAQLIRGDVTGGAAPQPLDSAQVIAIDLATATEYPAIYTNERGEFGLPLTNPGRFAVWVRKLGFKPHLSVLSVLANDTLNLEISLDEYVVEVEGVTVYGIAAVTDGQREFWSRRDLVWNTSVDYTEIEKLHQGTVSEVIEVLPLTIRGCSPIVYVDGFRRHRMNDLPLEWVYGIEVYRGYYNIPNRYRDAGNRRSQCGAVLLWTKARR